MPFVSTRSLSSLPDHFELPQTITKSRDAEGQVELQSRTIEGGRVVSVVVLALDYSFEFGSSGGWLKMLACFDKGEVGHGKEEFKLLGACASIAAERFHRISCRTVHQQVCVHTRRTASVRDV
jgi:hypothetical protein